MGSPETAWKAALAVVESGACSVEIACENVRNENAIAFAADLSTEECNHLQRLHLKCETIGELGRNALQQMMEQRKANLVISTPDRNWDYVGQLQIEPAMASETCVTLRISISRRRQTIGAASAALPAQVDASAVGPLKLPKSGDAIGTMEQVLTAKQTVNVHCLAGSSLELEINSGETGRDVAERIADRLGHPTERLVLTSGGCVIDERQPLLHQVQHEEITYVVQKLGAGGVAMRWERLLTEKTLTDVAALNENHVTDLGFRPKAQPEHRTSRQPAEFDFWRQVQPELAGHPTTRQSAEFDFWRQVQPEPGWHPTTQ